jgi:hypothetical protein
VENEWNLYSTDLLLTKDAHIENFDSLSIKQQYTKVDSVNWMPISNVFDYRLYLFGIGIIGYSVGFQSDYVIQPDLPKNFFKRRARMEELKKEEPKKKVLGRGLSSLFSDAAEAPAAG